MEISAKIEKRNRPPVSCEPCRARKSVGLLNPGITVHGADCLLDLNVTGRSRVIHVQGDSSRLRVIMPLMPSGPIKPPVKRRSMTGSKE